MFKPSIQNPSIVDSEEFPNVINAPCSIAITVDAPAEWFENNPTDSQDQAVQAIIGQLQDDLWQFVARARMMRETSGQTGQRLISRWPNLTAELTYNFGQEMLRLTVSPANEPSGEELSITTYGLKKVKVKFTAFPLPGASHNGGEPPTPQLKAPDTPPANMDVAYESVDPDTVIYYGSDSGPLNMYTYKPDKPGATSKKNSQGIYTSNDSASEPTDKRTIFKVIGSAALTLPIKGKAYWEVEITKLATAVPKDIQVSWPQTYRTGSTGVTLNGKEYNGCKVKSDFFNVDNQGFAFTWPKALNTFNSPQIGICGEDNLPADLVAHPTADVELYQDYGPDLSAGGLYVTRRSLMTTTVTCTAFDNMYYIMGSLSGLGRMVVRPPDGIEPWLNITMNWTESQFGNLVSSAGDIYAGPYFSETTVESFAPPTGPWADQAAGAPGIVYYSSTVSAPVTSKDAPVSGPGPGMRFTTPDDTHLTVDFVWQDMGFLYVGSYGGYARRSPLAMSLINTPPGTSIYPSMTIWNYNNGGLWINNRQFITSFTQTGQFAQVEYTIPANSTWIQVPTSNTLSDILAYDPPPEPGCAGYADLGGFVCCGSIQDVTYTETFDGTTYTLTTMNGDTVITMPVTAPYEYPPLPADHYTTYPAVTVKLGEWMTSELGGTYVPWPGDVSNMFNQATLSGYGTTPSNVTPANWYTSFQWSYSDPWQKLMTDGEHAPVFNGAGAPGNRAGPGTDDPSTFYTGVDFGSLKEGDVIMFAVDADQGLAWVGYNGKWQDIDGTVSEQEVAEGKRFTAVIKGGYYFLKYVMGEDPGPDFTPPKLFPAVGWNVGPFEAEFHYGIKNKYGPPGGFQFYGSKTTTV